MVFELRRFGTLGGIGKGNLSFQLFSYKIEEETIDDLLTIGYFKDLQGVVNINDVILVLDLKKDREYKNIEYFYNSSILLLNSMHKSMYKYSRLGNKPLFGVCNEENPECSCFCNGSCSCICICICRRC